MWRADLFKRSFVSVLLHLFIMRPIFSSVLAQQPSPPTLPPERFTTKQVEIVHGRRMAYVEVGTGDPIVFLHGNPTSSYLWRNIMPHLEDKGRLIAPDLIGFGDSEKLPPGDPSRYDALQHSNFLFALLERLGVKSAVTLVLHDWGSWLGFLWAYNNRFNPEAVKGIVFMEAIVELVNSSQVSPDLKQFFDDIRSPLGEALVLQQNLFIEVALPTGIIRNLSETEMEEYRRPFINPGEERRPMLTFPRQLPIDGVPANVAQIILKYATWLASSQTPKLFISANPGLLIGAESAKEVRTWSNLTEVAISGLHYVQEDEPDTIGGAISEWIENI